MLPPGSPKEHVCVVLNAAVECGSAIRYVYLTSREDAARHRLRHDPKALVQLLAGECLAEGSFVQCSRAYIYEMEYSEFVSGFESGAFHTDGLTQLTRAAMDKIVEGLHASETLSTNDVKRLLL